MLLDRINSRTAVVRSDSPSGLRLIPLLSDFRVSDMGEEWSNRDWPAILLFAAVHSCDPEVGSDAVWLFSLSTKSFRDIQGVIGPVACLVRSERWPEGVKGSCRAVLGRTTSSSPSLS